MHWGLDSCTDSGLMTTVYSSVLEWFHSLCVVFFDRYLTAVDLPTSWVIHHNIGFIFIPSHSSLSRHLRRDLASTQMVSFASHNKEGKLHGSFISVSCINLKKNYVVDTSKFCCLHNMETAKNTK